MGCTYQVYKDSVYVVGGAKDLVSVDSWKYYDEIAIFNFEDSSWRVSKMSESETKGGERPKYMKFMSSSLFFDKMLISGGMECSGEALSEVWTYSIGSLVITVIEKKIWVKLLVEYQEGAEYLKAGYFNHATVHIPRSQSTHPHLRKKLETVLLFGGRNSQKVLPSKTVLMRVSPTKCWVEILPTKGKAPSRRFDHSMTRIDHLNCVCVYGGQPLHTEASQDYSIFLFSLADISWYKCEIRQKNRTLYSEQRYCHSACLTNKNQMIVLGGLSLKEGYVPSSTIHVLSFLDVLNAIPVSHDADADPKNSERYPSRPVNTSQLVTYLPASPAIITKIKGNASSNGVVKKWNQIVFNNTPSKI